MRIEPSEYKRDDGVSMFLIPNGNWVVRRGGGCFFFDRTRDPNDPWGFKAANDLSELEVFSMTFGEAYRLLETLPAEKTSMKLRRSG